MAGYGSIGKLTEESRAGEIPIALQGCRGDPENFGGFQIAQAAKKPELHRALGFTYIQPELCDGRNEIALPKSGTLRTLVAEREIRGDLHAQTISSGGSDSMEARAAAARDRSYEYLGISDHSQTVKIARGYPSTICGRRYAISTN